VTSPRTTEASVSALRSVGAHAAGGAQSRQKGRIVLLVLGHWVTVAHLLGADLRPKGAAQARLEGAREGARWEGKRAPTLAKSEVWPEKPPNPRAFGSLSSKIPLSLV
jgi:hypothetical protein